MQLWKKNFLVMYSLFLIVIYSGLLFLDHYISQNELSQWVDHAVDNEKGVLYLTSGIADAQESRTASNLNYAAKNCHDMGILLKITVNGQVMADYLPDSLENPETGIVETGNGKYVIIADTQVIDADVIEIAYAESLEQLEKIRQRRTVGFCGAGALFSVVVGSLLYYMMKRVNRPVDHIAHELRTPLTGIQGYAQYMMMGNLTDEEKFYAAKEIADSAKNLEDVVEKLLIIGNVREGSIHVGRIPVRKLLPAIQKSYPKIQIQCEIESVDGDETLVRCLLENLVANAVNAAELERQVKVRIDAGGFSIWNNGKMIDERELKAINKGQGSLTGRVEKHGYGIQICQEIATVHGWKLMYESTEEGGTTVFCRFGKGK